MSFDGEHNQQQAQHSHHSLLLAKCASPEHDGYANKHHNTQNWAGIIGIDETEHGRKNGMED